MVASVGIKVLLTGEGVDEHFMGYGKYTMYDGPQNMENYYLQGLKGKFIRDVFDPETVKNGVKRAENYTDGAFWWKVRQMEVRCRLQKLLHRTDVILMEHSIEGRTPFLHSGIPDVASSISPVVHIGTVGKEVIRNTYQELIPGIAQKVKKRFKASENLFLDVFNSKSVKEIMYSPIKIEGINLDLELIDTIYGAYNEEKTDLSELLYLILTTKHVYQTLKH
jgi:asparagine synthase (glutamine-hydrolysing)